MQKNKAIQSIVKKSLPILRRNGVTKAGIFGSYARGEAKTKSDIDILIQLKKGKSLFDLVGIEQELAKKLNKKVDLITYKEIHPLMKERILGEEVRIF